MAQREGSVYLYLFVVALVLFFVMAVVFFMENADKQFVKAQLSDAQRKAIEFQDQQRKLAQELTDLRVLVGGPRYETELWPGDESIREAELVAKAQKAINATLEDLGESPRDYEYMTAVYDDVERLLLSLREARDKAFRERETASGELREAKTSSDETATELRKSYAEAQAEITRLRTMNEDTDQQHKAEKAELLRRVENLQTDLADQEISYKRQLAFAASRAGGLQKKLEVLQQAVIKEKTFENVEPDGQLLTVVGGLEKGWINLGRSHHLHKGIPFRVFQYVKGGKKHYKGRVEVVRVDEGMSEVRIIDEDDSLNPITGGDYITSPFYSPDEKPVFVFAGNELSTPGVSQQTLEAKMARFGAVVQDRVDIDTDFVVVMNGYESSSEYTAAKELGVTIIRDRELLDFLGN